MRKGERKRKCYEKERRSRKGERGINGGMDEGVRCCEK